jgi:hypothetical protein
MRRRFVLWHSGIRLQRQFLCLHPRLRSRISAFRLRVHNNGANRDPKQHYNRGPDLHSSHSRETCSHFHPTSAMLSGCKELANPAIILLFGGFQESKGWVAVSPRSPLLSRSAPGSLCSPTGSALAAVPRVAQCKELTALGVLTGATIHSMLRLGSPGVLCYPFSGIYPPMGEWRNGRRARLRI